MKFWKMTAIAAITVSGLAFGGMGCGAEPKSEAAKDNLHDDANNVLKKLKREDSTLGDFMSRGYGYVIFPDAGKGGFIAGGAFGRGEVYEQDHFIGYASMTKATVGAQIGGQSFSEIIVFEDKKSLDKFTAGNFAFTADVSAVALKSGAGASAKYRDGVAVFLKPNGGLMAEAAIGGQKFAFKPASLPSGAQ